MCIFFFYDRYNLLIPSWIVFLPECFAMREALGALKRDGSLNAVRSRMLSLKEYNEVLGLADVEAWEKRYLLDR